MYLLERLLRGVAWLEAGHLPPSAALTPFHPTDHRTGARRQLETDDSRT
jgi:hypothetical protein